MPVNKSKKSMVTFGKVQIYEFAYVIGDNPFVSGGVPIALGPTHIQESVMSIKQYERERNPVRRPRRELAMNRKTRKEL
jgi:hypothetical protein